ncbi:hypothetical protein [Tunicatimonas pelagia]|uniref:hypothetical protein n=1 Tax=Tunicatimonas pelagia TaxID=931531 RepID=UPI002665DCAF|nr:hypothetical protein [Tunicatimonas pelagia]WKN42698.1 hypothetical protein P0M28_27040 [Tunicatimonas pelagia]
MDKKRIVKDYEHLPEEIIERVKAEYPYGFEDNLITFTNREGKRVSALPFETEEIYYLIRMTVLEARQIIEDDDDYDDDGTLRSDFSVDRDFEGDDDEKDTDNNSSY